MTFASSSVSVVLRKIFLTRRVFPEGMMIPVVGIGGSPSFCCRLSAITKKALKPIFILWQSKHGKRVRDVTGKKRIHRHSDKTLILFVLYLWIDGKRFVRLAHTQEVIDYLLHSKVQSFL